ncbi:MAG: DUF72 domain-containing protein [Candidatus Eisenbacteria bacterium]|nr:DUF72 domain-containing protein [Candidatus Latescibacterota bacterium]MBD3300988.1 DUF72 domain-containing protein [Candidatus Eisenbacteria bacterium]
MPTDLGVLPPGLHVGTSSFSASDWRGVFYPEDLEPRDFLAHYAKRFRTVEIDATWHFMPNPRIVEGWERKVPDGFVFSAKVPKVITHEKQLVDCEEEIASFLDTMSRLGDKLGPLLFQFQYVSKRRDPKEYETGSRFLKRLEAFLPLLPDRYRYVVEVRNRNWLREDLTSLLAGRGIALALVDYVTMPRAEGWFEQCDPVTADFSYVRFLGDHRAMDDLVAKKRETGQKQGDWNELLVDRTREMRAWAPVLQRLSERVTDVYAYFNNHYAGYAPGSIELFLRTWEEKESGDAGGSAGIG